MFPFQSVAHRSQVCRHRPAQDVRSEAGRHPQPLQRGRNPEDRRPHKCLVPEGRGHEVRRQKLRLDQEHRAVEGFEKGSTEPGKDHHEENRLKKN